MLLYIQAPRNSSSCQKIERNYLMKNSTYPSMKNAPKANFEQPITRSYGARYTESKQS